MSSNQGTKGLDRLPLRDDGIRLGKVFKAVTMTLVVSVVVGIVSVRLFVFWPDIARSGLFDFLTGLVPSIGAISRYTQTPSLSAAVYGLQWLFAPIYLVILAFAAPWTRAMHVAVKRKAKNFVVKQKLLVVLGVLLLGIYYMAEFHLIQLPTLLNGRIVSPPDVNFLQIIYASNVALAVYGSLAVFCECIMFWVFLVLVCNLKFYLWP